MKTHGNYYHVIPSVSISLASWTFPVYFSETFYICFIYVQSF